MLLQTVCLRSGDNWRRSIDEVTSLRAFVKVIEIGSFAEAGRQLRLSRLASKYVAELEQSLGVQLLVRTTRHASPNEHGQMYFQRALAILSELDAADEASLTRHRPRAVCCGSMPRCPSVRCSSGPRSRTSWNNTLS